MNTVGPHTLYLGVDPGKVTGFSGWSPANDEWFAMEIDGRHRFMQTFEATLAAGWRIEVGCERYTIGAGRSVKSAQYDALYIIGALDWLSSKLGFPMRLQSVAEASDFVTKAKLETLGWYHATPGGHANMASRHLITYLATQHPHGDGAWMLDRFADLET